MAAPFTFTSGNTKPYFSIKVVNDLTNAAVDLSGATVALYFREANARTAKVSGASCTVTDAPNGLVEYRWASTDLDVPGIYQADFRVTHSDGKIQSVLIDGIVVKAKLG